MGIGGLLLAAAVGGVLLVTQLVGGSDPYALPKRFCSVPVDRAALEPLLPEGEELRQSSEPVARVRGRDELGNYERIYCRLWVDDVRIVGLTLSPSEDAQGVHPEDWTNALADLRAAREARDLPFPGRAVVGADEAFVQARCAKRYYGLVLSITVDDRHQPDSGTARRSLERYLHDFVPKAMSASGCTA